VFIWPGLFIWKTEAPPLPPPPPLQEHVNLKLPLQGKAKIFKFDVNLSFIQRDDFIRANVNNFTFYTEHAREE
jgi:hypothetical protein